MFKENKKLISIIIGLAFLFAILTTSFLIKLNNNRERSKREIDKKTKVIEENIKKYEEKEKEKLQTSVIDKNIINKETDIIYKVKYKKCKHEIIKKEKPLEDMIGLDRKEFNNYVKEKLLDWHLEMFSKEKVSLSSEKDTLCTNHFVVGEKNGKIAIFKIDEQGERVLHRIFKDTTISTIREENQKRLKKGIVVESEEEAIQVLEDFIS